MDFQNLLNQVLGTVTPESKRSPAPGHSPMAPSSSGIPGIVAAAAAGGLMGLLAGDKRARKFAGKAATYGGMAVLGGLAYKAYQNWNKGTPVGEASPATEHDVTHQTPAFLPAPNNDATFQLALVKAMIASAKADGHIDAEEQSRIFARVESLGLPAEQKGIVFECLTKDITPQELAQGAESLEQRSEIYLASCLAIDTDHPGERAYLDRLKQALVLPPGLPEHLEHQARLGLCF